MSLLYKSYGFHLLFPNGCFFKYLVFSVLSSSPSSSLYLVLNLSFRLNIMTDIEASQPAEQIKAAHKWEENALCWTFEETFETQTSSVTEMEFSLAIALFNKKRVLGIKCMKTGFLLLNISYKMPRDLCKVLWV